jgi:hypothetical protein
MDAGRGGRVSGHWIERPIDWRGENVVYCRLCGRLLTRRVWLGEGGETFCEPGCQEDYVEYWLPRHAASAGAAG